MLVTWIHRLDDSFILANDQMDHFELVQIVCTKMLTIFNTFKWFVERFANGFSLPIQRSKFIPSKMVTLMGHFVCGKMYFRFFIMLLIYLSIELIR